VKYVLFVCTHNAGRSQIAQALFNLHAPRDVVAESAGSAPVEHVWPEVVQVMSEIGIDISGEKPKRLVPEMQLHADWAVTLKCGDVCPYVPTVVEDWDVPDPAGRPLEVVREIRDEIDARVRDLIEHRLDAIRADRTVHQVRLKRLLPALINEFEGTKSSDEIRNCTDAILSRYEDAPVRSFMMTLAQKQARECLARDVCDVLETVSS
jgi:protein-tyrosine-phosphatase